MKAKKELQAEAEYILTCSKKEFNELIKDDKEAIDRISKQMPTPGELIKIGLERKRVNHLS